MAYSDAGASSRVSGVQSGAIMLKDNDGASLPDGYVLADGNNGTPDMRDTYPKGAAGTGDEGNTGGTQNVTLSNGEMPSHDHDLSASTDSHSESNHDHSYDSLGESGTASDWSTGSDAGVTVISQRTDSDGGFSHSHSVNNDINGSDNSHQNEPNFIELRYMMKT